MKRTVLLTLAIWTASVSSVASATDSVTPPPPLDLVTPASEDSAFPQLAADGKGGVFMTWIETLKDGAGHRLRIAHRKEGGPWEEPSTVHEGKDFWKNWADFPGAGVFADGAVMVHWLGRSGEATYDYNVKARISKDAGRTWGEPFFVNTDGIKAEHGFVSFAATGKAMGVVWLDGRETKGGHEGGHEGAGGGAMTLRYAEFLSDGTRVRESLLDAKVCDCCQTAVVSTPKGLLAAYRDRSDTELRDISLVRPQAETPAPRDFSKDGWKINACPVNGPSLASRGDAVAAAWFTMAGGKARVRAALSSDGGDTFSAPIEVDSAFPLGRVDIEILPSGDSLLTWLGRGDRGASEIRAVLLDPKGGMKPPFKIASTSMARASGFPRLALSGDEVVFAWTELQSASSEGLASASRVRTSVMRLKAMELAGAAPSPQL